MLKKIIAIKNVGRFRNLGDLSMAGRQQDQPPLFEVVACIAGRGLKVRRENMKKLPLATRGKVFTLQNMPQLIDCIRLKEYRTRGGTP